MANINCSGTVYSNNKKLVNIDEVYPVGAVYISVNNTSPSALFGGSWIEFEEGRVLWTAPTTITINNENEGTDTDTVKYRKIAAGLPDLEGYGGQNCGTNVWGVFARQDSPYGAGITHSSGTSSNNQLHFLASRFNSIYGNSTTVQPPAIRVYAWQG